MQEFDLYVCAAYHAQHGLDCTISSLEETAEWWCNHKRFNGWVAMMKPIKLGDYGFPGQMKTGMITKEDASYNPVYIFGDMNAEALERVRKAVEEYTPSAGYVEIVDTTDKELANTKEELDMLKDEILNDQQRRLTLEAKFDEIYRLLKRGAVNNNLLLFNIKKICEEVIDPAVLEDLDNAEDN